MRRLSNAAETVISGEVSAKATWSEDIYFREYDTDGVETALDISDLDFYMQFRRSEDQTSADLSISTADSLSIVADDDGVESILRINVTAGTFSNYIGDMICDLVAVDNQGSKTHYGHGVVTFLNDPVSI